MRLQLLTRRKSDILHCAQGILTLTHRRFFTLCLEYLKIWVRSIIVIGHLWIVLEKIVERWLQTHENLDCNTVDSPNLKKHLS